MPPCPQPSSAKHSCNCLPWNKPPWLDDLIISSCDATWEARIAHEMEERVDAVNRDEMSLRSADSVFSEMRDRFRA